jgi:hypothetical protein
MTQDKGTNNIGTEEEAVRARLATHKTGLLIDLPAQLY